MNLFYTLAQKGSYYSQGPYKPFKPLNIKEPIRSNRLNQSPMEIKEFNKLLNKLEEVNNLFKLGKAYNKDF